MPKKNGVTRGNAKKRVLSSSRLKKSTLAWLAAEGVSRGRAWVMQSLLDTPAQPKDLDNYAILNPGEGVPAKRRDLRDDDTSIRYRDYSPPDLWGTAYSILRVNVDPGAERTELMFHGGEELLFPIDPVDVGERDGVTDGDSTTIRYSIAKADPDPRGRTDMLEVSTTHVDVKAGQITRLNPQRPHAARALGNKTVAVWMAMRYSSDSPRGLVTTDDGGLESASPDHVKPRLVELEDLKSPTTFALIAWGISEALRVHRERAGLKATDLATLFGVHPSLLSRLESAAQGNPAAIGPTNLSLDTLVKISRYLRLPLPDLLRQAFANPIEVADLATPPKNRVHHETLLRNSESPHHLHVSLIDIPAKERTNTNIFLPEGTPTSWIVLRGNFSLTVAKPTGDVELSARPGSVVHFRRDVSMDIQADSSARIIQVCYSTACNC